MSPLLLTSKTKPWKVLCAHTAPSTTGWTPRALPGPLRVWGLYGEADRIETHHTWLQLQTRQPIQDAHKSCRLCVFQGLFGNSIEGFNSIIPLHPLCQTFHAAIFCPWLPYFLPLPSIRLGSFYTVSSTLLSRYHRKVLVLEFWVVMPFFFDWVCVWCMYTDVDKNKYLLSSI